MYDYSESLGHIIEHQACPFCSAAEQLYRDEKTRRTIYFSHVKGHSDHQWNDYADALANKGRESCSDEVHRRAREKAAASSLSFYAT